MFKTLRGRITVTYFLVVIISLVLASLFFLFFLSRYLRDRDREDLSAQVVAIAQNIKQINGEGPPKGERGRPEAGPGEQAQTARLVNSILNTEAVVLEAKLLIVSPEGMVVAESRSRPLLGERTVELPSDIFSQRGAKITRRFFRGLNKDYLFATAPTVLRGGNRGYLLVIKPVEQVESVAGSLVWYVVVAGLISLAISMVFALYLSGAISRPVRAVTAAARRIAAGDYEQEVEVSGIDETAELARDFNVMAERVRTAYEQQRDFVGNVSHELRTPLTSIEGFSQALLEGVSSGEEEQRRSLEIINQESKRLVRLLRDLLLLSEIDAGELKPEKTNVDVADMVRRLGGLYAVRAEEEGIAFRLEGPERTPMVKTDPDRLERVLTNLLDNALKYTGEGGTVTLSASVRGDLAQISVADTGTGIPPEHLPNIFDRFYRLERSRAQKHGGSGLGLSISKELVETLGGTISVQSIVGRGTTFTVTLPSN